MEFGARTFYPALAGTLLLVLYRLDAIIPSQYDSVFGLSLIVSGILLAALATWCWPFGP